MGTISLGSTVIGKVSLGSTDFSKISWGSTDIWSAGTSYTDTFDRANGALGADWGGTTTQPQIATNAAQNSTTSGNTPQLTFNVNSMMTDSYSVISTVKTPTGTAMVSSTYFYVLGRCKPTATQDRNYVALVGSGATLSSGIYTINAAGSSFTLQQSISGSWTTGQTAELRCVGNVYTAYRNGTQVAQWVDSGGLVPIDSSHRGFGFGTQPYNFGRGFATDSITAADL